MDRSEVQCVEAKTTVDVLPGGFCEQFSKKMPQKMNVHRCRNENSTERQNEQPSIGHQSEDESEWDTHFEHSISQTRSQNSNQPQSISDMTSITEPNPAGTSEII